MWKPLKIIAVAAGVMILAHAARAESHVYRLRVDGLACPFCAYGVEKKLSDLEGVEGLTFEINAGIVVVTMARGTALDEAMARKAVSEAGFTLRGFDHTKEP